MVSFTICWLKKWMMITVIYEMWLLNNETSDKSVVYFTTLFQHAPLPNLCTIVYEYYWKQYCRLSCVNPSAVPLFSPLTFENGFPSWVFCLWIVLVNLCLVTCDDLSQNVRFCYKSFHDVSTNVFRKVCLLVRFLETILAQNV